MGQRSVLAGCRYDIRRPILRCICKSKTRIRICFDYFATIHHSNLILMDSRRQIIRTSNIGERRVTPIKLDIPLQYINKRLVRWQRGCQKASRKYSTEKTLELTGFGGLAMLKSLGTNGTASMPCTARLSILKASASNNSSPERREGSPSARYS